jgi:subtilisin family serine protease
MSMKEDRPRLKGFASDIIEVNRRLVRPGDVLIDVRLKGEVTEILRSRGGEPYVPNKSNERNDWRQRRGAPDYGDLNRRLADSKANVELWTVPRIEDQLDLIEAKQVPGLHYNHVFVGEDFYHGGPGGPPTAIPGPSPEQLRAWTGDRVADIAVLDNGLPDGWQKVHGELQPVVDRIGSASLPDDPMDEGPGGHPDGVLDQQAGHGLFICGLIARVAPGLDIQLRRVLHASGEGEEALITTTLLELLTTAPSVKVISLSLGTFVPDDRTPLLADAILRLIDAGKVVVAAAGNAGGTEYGKIALFPARMEPVIAVGAYDSRNGDHSPWPKSCPGEVYAPGVDLVSSHVVWHGKIDWTETHGNPQDLRGWARWSGTSFATPLVAAYIATMLAGPHTTSANQAARDWIHDLDPSGWPDNPDARIYPVKGVTDWV